jgi:hypothetical protein
LSNRQLTNKQFSFSENIIAGCTGIEAARKAGYKGNDNCLYVIASDNLRKPKIRARILEHRARIEAKTELTVENWRQNLLDSRKWCYLTDNMPVCAAYDRMLGQHLGAFEADNAQKQQQLLVAIKNEQQIIDKAITEAAKTAKDLDNAPDALAI